MSDVVIETFPLGFKWPTVDPFLFCVHHDDAYPRGNGSLGPDASLEGRNIGSDFDGIDGWRMYHGSTVPGFPGHPHRGFETVTYVRRGLIDHSDSLGAAARFGGGDTQWLTAGSGIVHSEMFPLLDHDEPNPLELFQIWMNLPAEDKLCEPHFAMLWDGDVPHLDVADPSGAAAHITVIAGELDGHRPPPPPPNSWASRPESDVAIWHLRLDPDASWSMPRASGDDTVRILYFFVGDELTISGTSMSESTGALVDAQVGLDLRAGPSGAEILVLQGRPIGEPVAQYGPFVMNTEDEIRQTFADYRATNFGGWPWDRDDPVHPESEGRFARHADGRIEKQPASTP